MNWKKLFKDHILERGYDYYRREKVEILEYTEDKAEAVVSGSDDYSVSIVFDDGEIDEMYCDCPYACDGSKCKHMAALLYALDDLSEKTQTDSVDADTLINEASPELIREFLIKSLTYNEELKYKFIRFLESKRKKISVSDYKFHLDTLVIQYSEGEDYIDYRLSFQFFNETEELLTECTDILIAEKRYYDAYDIVRYYYSKLSITDIDDDGNLEIFYDRCMEIFKEINKNADIDSKRRIFNDLSDMLKNRNNYLSDVAFDFISTGFEEKEFLIKLLDYADKKIAQNKNSYESEKWILYRIKLMDKLDYTDNDIMEYGEKYPELRSIKDYLTESFIAKGNNEMAIKILEDLLKSGENTINDTERYHLKLKEIYKAQNDKKNYVRELWIILTELWITNIDFYLEFKSLFDADEWADVREQLYSSMKNQYMLPEYFIEEKLYDRLVSYVVTNKNIYLIEKYESYLAEDYSEFILNEYTETLNEEAEHTAKRSTYQRWADRLRHMKTLKGGKECVMEIIENWRMLYKNRYAMMQELDSVEYED